MSDPGTENDPLSISLPTTADEPRLADLFFSDMVDLGLRPDQDALRALAQTAIAGLGRDVHMWVARNAEGLVVGLVMATPFLSVKFPGRALWIEELYVAPGYRQRGVGRQLVEYLLHWAWENGIRGVELEAYRMNTAASILYRSLGFRRLPRERYAYDISEFEPEDG